MDKEQYKTLVFDFGNTLWGSAEAINETWRDTLEIYEIDFLPFIKKYHENYLIDEGAFCNIEKLKWTFSELDIHPDDPHEILQYYQQQYLKKCELNLSKDPFGTWKCIETIASEYNIGILSDNSEETKNIWIDIWESKGLDHIFDFFITSEKVGEWKPHPKMFNSIKSKLEHSLHKAVYFGNSLERDAPSEKFGYTFVHVYGHNGSLQTTRNIAVRYINEESMKSIGLL